MDLKNLIKNPFTFSLIIVLGIFLIVYLGGSNENSLTIRVFIYSFILILGLVFFHDGYNKGDMQDEIAQKYTAGAGDISVNPEIHHNPSEYGLQL